MQNIAYRQPSTRTHRVIHKNGSVAVYDEASSARFIIRTQSGYTGPIRPGTVHGYSLNCQDIHALQEIGNYYYADGRYEYGNGPVLSTIVSGFTYYPSMNFDDTYNEALSKLNSLARGDLDLSVSLSEHKQTQRMFNATERIEQYTRTFTRRFRGLKYASQAWLEYTYGIKPLVSDVFGIADEHIRIVLNKAERYTARGSRTWRMDSVVIPTIWGQKKYPIVGGYYKHSTTLGFSLAVYDHDMTRWTSLNPISLAWETLPYSFVVDWFYSVGSYLRNMETYLLYSSRFKYGYRTNLSVSEQMGRIYSRVDSGNPRSESLMTCHVKHTDIKRSILTSYPSPYLPKLQANLGSSRLTSAASLLAGMLRGRR